MKQQKLPFVWEIDNSGIISYLVGTDHFAQDVYKKDAEKRLNGIEQVLFEVIITDENKAEFEKSIDESGLMEVMAGPYIEQLTRQEQEKISRIIEIPIMLLRNEPLFLLKKYLLNKYSPLNYKAVDVTIRETAQEKNTKIYPLETFQEQLTTLKLDCEQKGLEDLKQLIRIVQDFKNLNNYYKTIKHAYAHGDTETIKKMLTKEKISKKTGSDRNITMATRSIPYLQQPTMIAVGAAHCIIEPTMQDVYESNGIKTKRID